MTVALLIAHGLIAVALIGAISHQAAALSRRATSAGQSFVGRYAAVRSPGFCRAVIALYVASFVLGGIIYPAYRLDVRIPLEEMRLGWALGLFEMKEHFGGIGLAALPLYSYYWKEGGDGDRSGGKTATTLLLAFIVWFDFLAGHVLNNIRGL